MNHPFDQQSTSAQNSVSIPFQQPSTSNESSHNHALTIAVEENDIYFIAGATLNYLQKSKSICENCINAIETAEDQLNPLVPRYRVLFTEFCDMGGLLRPKSGLYRVCRETEREFQLLKEQLLSEEIPINEDFVIKVKNNCQNVVLPECCNLKEKIIHHYVLVRCKGLKKHLINKRAYEISYASASFNKKQKLQ